MDCSPHLPGSLQATRCGARRPLIVEAAGSHDDLFPKDLCECAHPIAHAVKDPRLDTGTNAISCRCRGQLPGDFDGTATPDDVRRWREAGCLIGEANAVFGAFAIC